MTAQAGLPRSVVMTGSSTFAAVVAACISVIPLRRRAACPITPRSSRRPIGQRRTCRPQAARPPQVAGIHWRSPGHEGARYGRGGRVQHGINGPCVARPV